MRHMALFLFLKKPKHNFKMVDPKYPNKFKTIKIASKCCLKNI